MKKKPSQKDLEQFLSAESIVSDKKNTDERIIKSFRMPLKLDSQLKMYVALQRGAGVKIGEAEVIVDLLSKFLDDKSTI